MSETSAGTKEESSDESTIVSSQPSTLTRNQRNAFYFVYLLVDRSFYHLFLLIGGPMSGLEVVEQGTDSEDEEDSDDESVTDNEVTTQEATYANAEVIVSRMLEKASLEQDIQEEEDEEDEEEEIERVYVVEPIQVCVFVPFSKYCSGLI